MTRQDMERRRTARTAGKNSSTCILKAKAPKIKPVITKLQEFGIDFNVNPSFDY